MREVVVVIIVVVVVVVVGSKLYRLTSNDVVFMASPLTFDPSVVEIFTTLSCGATLLIVDESMKLRRRRLLTLLTNVHHVTVLQVTDTVMITLQLFLHVTSSQTYEESFIAVRKNLTLQEVQLARKNSEKLRKTQAKC